MSKRAKEPWHSLADLSEVRDLFFGTDPDADLNGDGIVKFADLNLMKLLFFAPPGPSGVSIICGFWLRPNEATLCAN